jgi:hypothetical protein
MKCALGVGRSPLLCLANFYPASPRTQFLYGGNRPNVQPASMYCSFVGARHPWNRMLSLASPQIRLSIYYHNLFVRHRTIEPRFLPRQPENPRSRNCGWSIKCQPPRKSACQFVYHGTVCAICRTPNNRGLLFSPPAREPAIPNL